MIPSRHAYYRNRANEHRRLAQVAAEPAQRLMHDRLVEAYLSLARESRLRQVVRLKA
ncbi:hypothetical protein M2337_001385 [Sphingobium sp. B2D3A]|uniref:hypothetical protein n=1 Tax=unclassified Sphingobium TaxID=2611147 RepID=UPI0022243807|nr:MULTISPECIES: hypothetical protein [unclassified Sphingobium]MCW2337152.1 hypothetical protein [Sphingobium sp. B2D3A]MCW2383610.1 hypothetical protein [Sphingobium sp. B2D3D]MCW2388850.1 hypothetical protein [Sphingobium sp. B11D3B]MCW2393180.1 hypothetical protein [Sphingobium sp. B11D3A]MCW2395381.1 hypothetical protein [Sphingobium sp. B8D3B]